MEVSVVSIFRALRLAFIVSLAALGFPDRGLGQAVLTPITLTAASYNQDMVVDVGTTNTTEFLNSVTATMDGGTGKGGNTWYARGQNTASPNTGLPMGTTVVSEVNTNARYTLLAANVNNAIMLDGATTMSRLTFATPGLYSTISFLTSSGNGDGTFTMTINFSDGFAAIGGLTFQGPSGRGSSPDWFFVGDPIALTARGRINPNNGNYDAVDSDNPRFYAEDFVLPAAAAQHPIASIDIAWTGSGGNTHTAIFALSGVVVPEPSSLALCGFVATGATGLGLWRRKRNRA
jgi:hypothetical protein